MIKKTFVLYTQLDSLPEIYLVDEDWTRFDGLVVNTVLDTEEQESLMEELCNLLWDQTSGDWKLQNKIEVDDLADRINDLYHSPAEGLELYELAFISIGFIP